MNQEPTAIRDLLSYQELYSQQPFEPYQVAFRKRKILEIIQKYQHHSILEIGCGLESIFLELDSFEQMTVVEPAPIFFKKAQIDLIKAKNSNVQIKNCSLEELPAEDFDFILASGLLHEVLEPEKFLQALRSFCSSKTVVHINVPNARSFHRLLAVKMGLIPSEIQPSEMNIKLQQQRVYDLTTLSQAVLEQGFEIIESGSYFFKPFHHSLMQQLIDAKFLTQAMIDGFYQMEDHLEGIGSEIFVNFRKI